MKGQTFYRDEWKFFIRRDGDYYKIMSQYQNGQSDRAYIAWDQFTWARCPMFRSLSDARAYIAAYLNYLL